MNLLNYLASTLLTDPNTGSTGGETPGGGGGGSENPSAAATPAPDIPDFSPTATQITAGQNVAQIVAAGSVGDHFYLLPGQHNIDNVLVKSGMHIRFAEGAFCDGTNRGYAFRPANSNADNVVIGGDPDAATRPSISNYGNGTSNEGYGAIMGRTDDILNNEYLYRDVDGWFIYNLDFGDNSSNGILLGSNFTIYNNIFHGHSVTGVAGNRIVGGLIHSNNFYWNALNPSSGATSNGAQIKCVWINADPGRTAVTPVDRTKAPMIVSSNTFNAFNTQTSSSIVTNRAVWFDLDCQQIEVEYNKIYDHPWTSIIFEGCNNCSATYNYIENSNGYGVALGQDFINAAISVNESTNCYIGQNTLDNCYLAMANVLSNRSSDWLDTSSPNVNYADDTGPRYWLLNTTTIPQVDGQSNIYSGNNTFDGNILIECDRVYIAEGTDNGTQTVQGVTNVSTIDFEDNDYTLSPGISFYDRSLTALNLSQWQALGYDNTSYTTLYSTDFSDANVMDDFNIYDQPVGAFNGNNGWGGRRASQVALNDGTHPTEGYVMNITAEMGSGSDAGILLHGGAKLWGNNQDYSFRFGRIRFRMRCDADPDEVTSGLALLWQADTPTVKGPEINMFENFADRDTRDPVQIFSHSGEGGLTVTQGAYATGIPGTQWHDYEVIWKTNLLSFQRDSEPVVILTTDPVRISQEEMDIAFQLDAWADPAISNPDNQNPAHQPDIGSATVVQQVSSFSIEV